MPSNPLQQPKLFYNAEETKKPESSIVQGKIPEYVQGDFIRVGPGMWDLPEAKMAHFLDGYAILIKFKLDGKNNVTLEKKFLESDAYKRAMVAKKPVVNEFGTRAFSDSSKSFFSRVVASLMPELSDNNYSTPFQFNSELLVGAESGAFRSLDPGSLCSTERHDAKKCWGCEGLTAHPLKDENGDLFNMAMSLSMTALKMNIVKIPGSNSGVKTTKEAMKKGKIFCTLPNRRNGAVSSPHSFGMTPNYLIVAEHPFFISMSKVLSSLVKGTTINEWFDWHPEDKSVFYVIEKATGKIVKTEYVTTDPFYFMHFINCYEESDQIVVDINCYDSPAVVETLNLGKLRGGDSDLKDHPFACRYVLPLVDTRSVTENVNLVTVKATSTATRVGEQIILTPEVLTEIRGAELPSMNPKFVGKKYSYYYMAGTYNPSHFSHSICKVNVDKNEVKVWKDNDYNYPSEPLFIPNPNGMEEDDGVLLSTVTDSRPQQKDFLLYLDAKTLTELGRAYFDNRIPTGLHGIFLPTP